MDGRTQHRACPQCDKPLRDEQKTYCSKACRLEGMRAAKAQQNRTRDQQEKCVARASAVADAPGKYSAPRANQIARELHEDWRRPKADADAMASWHRRSIERL